MADSPVTVMVSETLPTGSVTLMTAVWPAESVTPFCSNFLKPASSAATSYLPRGRRGARYSPSLPLTTTRWAPVSVLVTVTVTPGSAAPVLSATVPWMLPLIACDCASAGNAVPSTSRAAIARADHSRIMFNVLLDE